MLAPSYQPSFIPSVVMPKASETAAATIRMISVKSLQASHTKAIKFLPFLRGYVFDPNAFRRAVKSEPSPLTPFSVSVFSIFATPEIPPCCRRAE
uniref:Uncharacterized protein n=1 Tax=Arundo donax TaxID=35708 RepID=A0A0A9DRB0_ARUDO